MSHNKGNLSIVDITNSDGCFDLQFRKDTRHKRTGSPTYYRWKMQFVITSPKSSAEKLKKVGQVLRCGKLTASAGQARYSVQKIEDINNIIIPYFYKNPLSGNKKNDFNLWQKAAKIIYENKGKALLTWKKSDFLQLLQIHKSAEKYKIKPRESRWFKNAQELAKTLK